MNAALLKLKYSWLHFKNRKYKVLIYLVRDTIKDNMFNIICWVYKISIMTLSWSVGIVLYWCSSLIQSSVFNYFDILWPSTFVRYIVCNFVIQVHKEFWHTNVITTFVGLNVSIESQSWVLGSHQVFCCVISQTGSLIITWLSDSA